MVTISCKIELLLLVVGCCMPPLLLATATVTTTHAASVDLVITLVRIGAGRHWCRRQGPRGGAWPPCCHLPHPLVEVGCEEGLCDAARWQTNTTDLSCWPPPPLPPPLLLLLCHLMLGWSGIGRSSPPTTCRRALARGRTVATRQRWLRRSKRRWRCWRSLDAVYPTQQ